MAVWRLQVNTGGANVADYCLQNHVAALWAGKVLAMERLRFKNLSESYLLNLWLCYKLTFVILSHNNIVKTLLVFQQSPIDYI